MGQSSSGHPGSTGTAEILIFKDGHHHHHSSGSRHHYNLRCAWLQWKDWDTLRMDEAVFYYLHNGSSNITIISMGMNLFCLQQLSSLLLWLITLIIFCSIYILMHTYFIMEIIQWGDIQNECHVKSIQISYNMEIYKINVILTHSIQFKTTLHPFSMFAQNSAYKKVTLHWCGGKRYCM